MEKVNPLESYPTRQGSKVTGVEYAKDWENSLFPTSLFPSIILLNTQSRCNKVDDLETHVRFQDEFRDEWRGLIIWGCLDLYSHEMFRKTNGKKEKKLIIKTGNLLDPIQFAYRVWQPHILADKLFFGLDFNSLLNSWFLNGQNTESKSKWVFVWGDVIIHRVSSGMCSFTTSLYSLYWRLQHNNRYVF